MRWIRCFHLEHVFACTGALSKCCLCYSEFVLYFPAELCDISECTVDGMPFWCIVITGRVQLVLHGLCLVCPIVAPPLARWDIPPVQKVLYVVFRYIVCARCGIAVLCACACELQVCVCT